MKASRVIALLAAVALVFAACGGDSGTTTTTSAPDTTTVDTSTQDLGNGAVDDLEDVRGAIVRIVAEGSFADPEFGQQYNAAGSGSGFFISEDGLAVTNNHVVTGAAFLQVYVDGDDEPRNARVLGVSECSDLAVIDVEGEGYPYLEWYEDDVAVGTEIFAAGFPLGNEEYTLLDGIVSKENADGESDWASVDSVIEHSADTLPGNSGGPIVTADGKVVAVNYAGDGAGQAFGIGRDEALEVLPRLIAGEDVTSLGINGQALSDGAFSGIWVASVASGSPADLGGIKAGDLVTLIEGLIPATDGTMADYCDILRSHALDDPLSVEIYRAADDLFLEGTLNTDRILEASFSFESSLQDEVAAVSGDGGGTTSSYNSYVTITDINNTISVDVPAEWSDTITDAYWEFEGQDIGATLGAAADYEAWKDDWTLPGMFFGASATIGASETVESLLDWNDFSSACEYDGRYDYEDNLYTGAYDVWMNCDGGENLFVVVVAQPPGSSVLMALQISVVSDADLEAMDMILNTFVVDEAALADLAGAATAAPEPAPPPPPAGDGLVIEAHDLLPGMCFNDADVVYESAEDFINQVTTTSCDVPHDNEVVLAYEFPDTPYLSDEAVWEHLDMVCAEAWPGYVGIPYAESSLYFFYFSPNSESWAAGNRMGICIAYDGDLEPLVGSVFMSGW
jgi:serine protease Do